jgi:O-antigen/teichoic acid export membrane protein
MTAINLKGWKKILGIITLPSISSLMGGYIFNTSSPYMVYMIPAIWIGNFAIVYSYKLLLVSKQKNYFLAGVVGVIVKVAIIFAFFNIINAFGIFPEKVATVFKTAMGSTQAITATCGVIVSAFIYYPIKKVKKI